MAEKNDERTNSRSFHSASSIAQRWDCSEKHVRREIAKGNLVAHKFGNIVRVADEDLLRYERLSRGN